MTDVISWFEGLQVPSAVKSILMILLLVLACMALGAVLKFILKFIFKQIKFVICLIIAVVLVGGFVLKSAIAPIQRFAKETGVADAMAVIADEFKGIYSGELPVLAWRFTDVTEESDSQMDIFEDEGEDSAQGEEESNEVRVRIDYLPFGSSVVVYDRDSGEIRIEKPIDQK